VRHNTNNLFIWAQSDSVKGKIMYFSREMPQAGTQACWQPFPSGSHRPARPQAPSPLQPHGPSAEVKHWWSWRLSSNLTNLTGLLRPLPLPLRPRPPPPPCSPPGPSPAALQHPAHGSSSPGTRGSMWSWGRSILVQIVHVNLALPMARPQTGALRASWPFRLFRSLQLYWAVTRFL